MHNKKFPCQGNVCAVEKSLPLEEIPLLGEMSAQRTKGCPSAE